MTETHAGAAAPADKHLEIGERPVRFEGQWGEFLEIFVVNLVLTILTLGIYRFWAKTRVRRYLWSRTYVIDDYLEYTGTGLELFLGFLIVFFVLLMPLAAASILLQMLVATDNPAAALIFVAIYAAVLYLFGVAIYRMQRYRFSRTRWHGIRGGMAERGWKYGLLAMGAMLLNVVTLGLAFPYTQVRLWNYRYNRASIGSIGFESRASSRRLYKPLLIALALGLGYGLVLWQMAPPFEEFFSQEATSQPPEIPWSSGMWFVALVLTLYAGWALIALIYFVTFYREVVSGLRWGEVAFRFNAGFMDWVVFWLVNFLIIAFTLGLGAGLMPMRTFKFIGAYGSTIGAPDVEQLRQSSAEMPEQGEGLAEAFDVGGL